jgi:glycosyltransferase involved in cell wall biosynthesis
MVVAEPGLVSVVIPVFDGERYVRAAIESVLRQTLGSLECIVIDDGSDDSTPDVLGSIVDPRIRVVRQEQAGVAAARNRGIAEARGEYIAFLDSDDVWLSDKLERQIDAFADPSVGVSICSYAITDEELAPLTIIHPDGTDLAFRGWLLDEGNGPAFASTAIVRSEVLAAVGSFDPTLSTSADLDLAVRLAAASSVALVDVPLVLYRTHKGQMHRALDVREREMEAVFVRHAERVAGPGGIARGRANLHTRHFVYAMRARQPAWRHLLAVLRSNPTRLVALPMEAALRRTKRRLRAEREIAHVLSLLERDSDRY